MDELDFNTKGDLRVILQTKAIPLMSGYSDSLLDDYVLVVITNPIEKIKLLSYYYKLKKKDVQAYESIDLMLRFRNSVVHNSRVTHFDVSKLLSSLVYITNLTNDLRWDEIIKMIVTVMHENNVDVPMYEVLPLSSPSTEVPSQLQPLFNILPLAEVKKLYRNKIKRKRVQILDGVHAGKIGTFVSWNGKGCRISVDNQRLQLPLTRKIKFLE
jgi:hypothetical protein